jgi:hypothetical protein
MRLRYDELDVFRLDVIARELKVIDEHMKAATSDEGKWGRGHVKDVINQCLKETHKLHIGAPTHDPGGNETKIVGCGRKAYLIVDADEYPDATSL